MRETLGSSPDKRKKRKSNPGLALALAAALHSAIPAPLAEAQEGPKNSAWSSSDVFKAPNMDRAEYEDGIDAGGIPLEKQVAFISYALGKGGPYFKEFHAPELDLVHMSEIYHYIDKVSARMTLAYTAHEIPKGMEKVFNTSVIERSTKVLDLKANIKNKRVFCNGFYANADGAAVFITDAHCMQHAAEEEGKDYFIPADPRTDIAVRNATDEVPDLSSILQFDRSITDESIAGRVTASFSFGLEGEKKVDFSFVVPERESWYQVKKDAFVILRPPQESEILERDKKTEEVTKIGASGSSGSAVGVLMDDGTYHLAGNLLMNTNLEDTCQNICYSAGLVQAPDAIRETIKAARVFWGAAESKVAQKSAPTVEGWSASVKEDIQAPKPRPAKRPR